MILKPDLNVKTLFDIDIDYLKLNNIKVILFDLDSTVMPSKSGKYPANVYEWLKDLQKDFHIAVLSNNTNENYLNLVREQSFFDVIGNAKKPNPYVAKQYLAKYKFKNNETIIVGDRPLTDILVGKCLGCKTILVDSITRETETKLVRCVRYLERLCIR